MTRVCIMRASYTYNVPHCRVITARTCYCKVGRVCARVCACRCACARVCVWCGGHPRYNQHQIDRWWDNYAGGTCPASSIRPTSVPHSFLTGCLKWLPDRTTFLLSLFYEHINRYFKIKHGNKISLKNAKTKNPICYRCSIDNSHLRPFTSSL